VKTQSSTLSIIHHKTLYLTKKQLSKSMPHTCDGTLRKTTIYKTMSYGKKGRT
jgi:hypothetical protein